jgi:hypothetical protein
MTLAYYSSIVKENPLIINCRVVLAKLYDRPFLIFMIISNTFLYLDHPYPHQSHTQAQHLDQ